MARERRESIQRPVSHRECVREVMRLEYCPLSPYTITVYGDNVIVYRGNGQSAVYGDNGKLHRLSSCSLVNARVLQGCEYYR